ncbi:ferritin-like fold-containing protein [Streptomyces sp. NBC_00859]|uniref:ferritin-like fold-containing protein n=1 Tax=Streptomyces sp. NBC_00859 TaxID=2903682 RepID=UPI003869D3E4|nr:ferritin-like fold-containing protein [Streptomyces sp. NBC_00859]
MPNQFALDLSKIREDARKHLNKGPVTSANTSDLRRLIDVLNEVVATEMVCYLRYTQNAIVAQGINREQVAALFREHADEELDHFKRVSDRINQLGGTPDLDPATLVARSHTEYEAPAENDLQEMIRENFVAERIAVETYTEIVRWIGDSDPTSRRLMEDLLKEEEDHADELSDLYEPKS